MSEAKFHKAHVSQDDPCVWFNTGTPVTVDGSPMIRFGQHIVPAKGWHATKAEAQVAAAKTLEAQAAAYTTLAAQLRKEAADALAAR